MVLKRKTLYFIHKSSVGSISRPLLPLSTESNEKTEVQHKQKFVY